MNRKAVEALKKIGSRFHRRSLFLNFVGYQQIVEITRSLVKISGS